MFEPPGQEARVAGGHSRGLVAGIDIGGTNHTISLASIDGVVLATRRGQRAPGETARNLIQSIFGLLEAALSETQAILSGQDGTLRAVGIGFGGPVDHRRGVVLTSHHVAEWQGYPLRDRVSAHFGVPVSLDNDANAAALGEARFGAGRGRRDLLYVNIGTGIGAGLIIDGRLYRGASGLAGEIGHMTLDPAGPPCDCGKRGCLEAYASGRSLGRQAREATARAPAGASAIVKQAGGDPAEVEGPHVVAAARNGDPLARRLLSEMAERLAYAFGAAANLLNPGAIILGGGVASAGDLILTPLCEALPRYLMPGLPVPDVLAAALGYDAGVIGAVALALEAKT